MNKKILIIGITVLFLTIALSGCFESGENPVIGTWEMTDFQQPLDIKIEYNFFEGKKFLQILFVQVNQSQINHTFLGSYEISGKSLTLSYENNLPFKNEKYTYEISNNTLILSIRNVSPVQYINLTRISNEPIRKWPNAGKTIKVSPKSFTLEKDVLPEGYIICQNRTEEPGKIVDPIDAFTRVYSKENCSNEEESILLVIMKFRSNFDASIFYNETKLGPIIFEPYKILNDSVDTIGDASFAHYVYEKLNISPIFYWFRVSNIVCLVKVPKDYNLSQSLAKLVEQKIYDTIS